MILSGEKREEYRELKEYWRVRLANKDRCYHLISFASFITIALPNDFFTPYTHIEFTNGYSAKGRRFLIECHGIRKGYGRTAWGAEYDKEYIVMKLGEIIEKHNIK